MIKFLLLFIAFSTSAMANLLCTNAFNEELAINYLNPKTFEGKIITPVQVIFNENGNTHEFLGDYTSNSFELSSSEYSAVSLLLAKSTNHGGRCGRCSPELFPKLNAQLKLDQTTKYFSCSAF